MINFELPNVPEQYVHRIGRTARAGRDGIALSFCAPDAVSYTHLGAIGSPLGAQPVTDAMGNWLSPGSIELSTRCAELAGLGQEPLACSKEALAHVLREVGYLNFGNLIGFAAFLALPSVILVMLYGLSLIHI